MEVAGLKSAAMKTRFLEAKERTGGITLDDAPKSLESDAAALDDLAWWVQRDRKKAMRIIRLIQGTLVDPLLS